MSTLTPPQGPSPTTVTDSQTSPSSSTQESSGSTTDATLYLYTFLATLVLLLAVSSAIVIRSLVLRRRHQRLVEEAIRTGTWLPQHVDATSGRRRRDMAPKPTLWEAWLHARDDDDDGEHGDKQKWSDITPVYATYIHSPASAHPPGSVAGSTETLSAVSRPSRFMRPFTRRSAASSQPGTVLPMAGQTLSVSCSSPTTHTPAVLAAVLIAMPTSHRHTADESGPPVVEIGVVEASVRGDETETLREGA